MTKQVLKNKILQEAKTIVEQKIENFKEEIAQHENTKIQPQAESIDMDYRSQSQANHEISNLLMVSLNAASLDRTRLDVLEIDGDLSEIVEPGAVVMTNHGTFFVSVSTTSFEIDGKEVMGISTKSPIFNKMVGMEKGDQFELRALKYQIDDIF